MISRCLPHCAGLLVVVFTGAGCAHFPSCANPQETEAADRSKAPAANETASSGDAGNGNEKTGKKTPPRTLPQAICAYFHSLHEPLPPDKDKAASNGASSDEKSPPAAGEKEVANGAEAAKPNNDAGDKDKSPATKNEDTSPGDADAKDKKDSTNGEKETSKPADDKEKEAAEPWYSAHAQATMVTQDHSRFHSPYQGANSLLPVESSATSITGTLFLDFRLWEGGELVFNPEMSGGRGLSNVLGVAGFPNGEITRVGVVEPTPYFARLFVRQTFPLGDEREKVDDAVNQITGTRPVDRFTVVVGKLAATDWVDDNRYSHDPRTQFLDWALMYNGAWDYPANVRGYTYGIGLEYNTAHWAWRYGVFAEPSIANGAPLDPHILKAQGQVMELEERYKLWDKPGKVRFLAYLNHAHMGNYDDALALMPVNPDITSTEAYRYKYGFGLNIEQELTKDLGLFSRLGWNDGHSESWAFTEIDRTGALGLLLKGTCWRRPNDQLGVAGVVNGLSGPHRAYLAAGGLGFILGDGQLSYDPETILETFYNFTIRQGIVVTADCQEIFNPADNTARGPVFVGSLRVHLEY
jgi:high affinity Mn2+ porin